MLIQHVYSDGRNQADLFLEREDFVFGMNRVAICASVSGVEIYAFCLMSNHFHFVLSGDSDATKHFIDAFKRSVGVYLHNKYGSSAVWKSAAFSIRNISDNEELKSVIGYCLRNPVNARIVVDPLKYEWSSITCYFIDCYVYYPPAARRVSELSYRQVCRLTKCRMKLPPTWQITEEGMILPSSYVKYESVEKSFSSSRSYDYFTRGKKSVLPTTDSSPLFDDSQLYASMKEICGESEFMNLSFAIKRRVIEELRFKFKAPTKQIARVLNVPEESIRMIIGT